ncbi:MAG: phosphatase PAP2 family protein [Acidobacteria bacterium]|nr:phosphatase PAP2 family protein [Acidobacteriota bacterium]
MKAEEPDTHMVSRRRAGLRLRRAQLVYIFGLGAFALLALSAHFYSYFGWDLRVSQALQSFDAPALQAFMRAVSFIGNVWHPYALTALTVIILFAFNFRSEAVGLALSAGGSGALNGLLKIIIARPRPTTDLVNVVRSLHTQSFPSGHVTFYVCYFGFLFFAAYAMLPRGSTARRIALVLLALPVLLVGLSRVYLGAHWPSDALGAYLFGGLWLALSLNLYRRWKERATFHRKAQ